MGTGLDPIAPDPIGDAHARAGGNPHKAWMYYLSPLVLALGVCLTVVSGFFGSLPIDELPARLSFTSERFEARTVNGGTDWEINFEQPAVLRGTVNVAALYVRDYTGRENEAQNGFTPPAAGEQASVQVAKTLLTKLDLSKPAFLYVRYRVTGDDGNVRVLFLSGERGVLFE